MPSEREAKYYDEPKSTFQTLANEEEHHRNDKMDTSILMVN